MLAFCIRLATLPTISWCRSTFPRFDLTYSMDGWVCMRGLQSCCSERFNESRCAIAAGLISRPWISILTASFVLHLSMSTIGLTQVCSSLCPPWCTLHLPLTDFRVIRISSAPLHPLKALTGLPQPHYWSTAGSRMQVETAGLWFELGAVGA